MMMVLGWHRQRFCNTHADQKEIRFYKHHHPLFFFFLIIPAIATTIGIYTSGVSSHSVACVPLGTGLSFARCLQNAHHIDFPQGFPNPSHTLSFSI